MKQIIEFKQDKKVVQSPEEVFKNIKKINIEYEQENFLVLFLDIGNKLLGSEVVFKGGIDACLICPNTIFRKALLKNSKKIIVAHNHPSGNLVPSSEDEKMFDGLKVAGKYIEIEVLDSIIFNKKRFFSMLNGENN